MTKRVSIAKLKEDCAKLTQKLVRLKAADKNGYCECVTCGIRKHWKEMQGGHFIERRKTSTLLVEENIHPQCPGCNLYRMKLSSTILAYRRYMVDMYGEHFVTQLEIESSKPKKFTADELYTLKKELNERIDERLTEIS